VILGADDGSPLAAIIGDRSRPLKHAQRARIVLFSAERLPVLEVARRAGVSRPAALAAALWRGGRRRPPARQEPAAGQGGRAFVIPERQGQSPQIQRRGR
jgi:hypothetical protein